MVKTARWQGVKDVSLVKKIVQNEHIFQKKSDLHIDTIAWLVDFSTLSGGNKAQFEKVSLDPD